MKVKYFGTLFAASILSLGLLASCAPKGGETDAGGEAPTQMEDGAAPADSGAAPAESGTEAPADSGQ